MRLLVLLAACATPPQAAASAEPAQDATPVVTLETLETLPDLAEQAVRGVVSIRVGASGVGSGVVVDDQGHVLTNHHVIERRRPIEVTTHDGRTFEAELVGSDDRSDVALLRLVDPPEDLEPLELADHRPPRLGEVVLAIGNPFGVGQTVTMGIVSAVGRSGLGIEDYEDFIQTDAAINPGNSGGALVDLNGQLIGINTAIVSRSGGNQGVGLAIPTSMAKAVMNSLLDDGRVQRGWLGVHIQDLHAALAEALDVDIHRGVVVAEVVPDSPADELGLERGDVVVTLDGDPVTNVSRFRTSIAMAGPGAEVVLEVRRKGETKTLSGVLGELPERP